MRRILVAASLILALAGCHAPTPSMNVLAPYGSATVPPPATGAVGTSGDYYAPPNPAATGSAPAALPNTTTSPTGAAPGAFMGAESEPTPAGSSGVVPASYTPGTTGRSATSTIGSGVGPGGSTLKINGMPVNDATSTGADQAEPINLTQLPDASQSPSFLRILSPNPARNPVNPTPAAQPPATVASGNWQTR